MLEIVRFWLLLALALVLMGVAMFMFVDWAKASARHGKNNPARLIVLSNIS